MSTFPGAQSTTQQNPPNPFKKENEMLLRRNQSVTGVDSKVRSGNYTPRGQQSSGQKFDNLFGQRTSGGAGTQLHKRKQSH